MAPLAEDKAVVCWLDDNTYDYGFCSVLLVAADGTITHGSNYYGRQYGLSKSSPSVSVTALDGEWAVACWRDASYYMRCTTLNVAAGSSTTITVGTLYYVSAAGQSSLVPAVTALDAASALLCYRGSPGNGQCVVLTRSGSALSAGSSTYFYSGSMGLVDDQTSSWVSAFSATSAIACYRARAPQLSCSSSASWALLSPRARSAPWHSQSGRAQRARARTHPAERTGPRTTR